MLGFTETKDIGNNNEICWANCGRSRRLEEEGILSLISNYFSTVHMVA